MIKWFRTTWSVCPICLFALFSYHLLMIRLFSGQPDSTTLSTQIAVFSSVHTHTLKSQITCFLCFEQQSAINSLYFFSFHSFGITFLGQLSNFDVSFGCLSSHSCLFQLFFYKFWTLQKKTSLFTFALEVQDLCDDFRFFFKFDYFMKNISLLNKELHSFGNTKSLSQQTHSQVFSWSKNGKTFDSFIIFLMPNCSSHFTLHTDFRPQNQVILKVIG